MGRRAAQRDANEPEIVTALEAVGASVERLDAGPGGIPDLLVGYRGANYLLEVKTASGKLRRAQLTWHPEWRGQVSVVRTAEEAWAVIGAEVA